MAKFRTRARTVEMLGRQQIAGIPTAISELFKNAHDAYARRVEVDYFRSDGLFILRDDGLGMTLADFERRWLTLGTESKLGEETGIQPPPSDPDQVLRPILGEKGIGRLAIAAIGPQLLIITRAKRDALLHQTVAAYIHWGIFECPGIDLDDIEIPVRMFAGGHLPSKTDVAEMLTEFRQNFNNLSGKISDERVNRIISDIEIFTIDPIEINRYLAGLTLTGEGSGTHFIILPASRLLSADIDDSEPDRASPLQKALLGFTNTMTPGHREPVIQAAFRDHKTDETWDDLVNEREFFTPDEFLNADHHISGRFDEFGQFQGTISIYGEEHKDHIITWRGGSGHPAICGPFGIDFATVQGAERESTIPFEDWGRLINKMNRIGGLYIYKDGIRILPYGDTDYDWLDIEKNRTKKASYYYFSYRRIFGVVEITQSENPILKEKSGREGFIENHAYRQFKSILRSFFVQIAVDFFREGGPIANRFQEYKAELERLEIARRKRERLVSVRRNRFSEEIRDFFLRYDAGKPQEEALKLTNDISKQLEFASKIEDPKSAAKTFLEIESTARRLVAELQERYHVTRPRGIGFSKSLEREWNSYLQAYDRLKETVFVSAVALVEDVVSQEAHKARLELDRRLRIENALNLLSHEARKVAKIESTETRETLNKVEKEITEVTRDSLAEVEKVLKEVFAAFARLDVSNMKDSSIVEARDSLESRITTVKEREEQFLHYIQAQLEAIDVSKSMDRMDEIEALEQRSLALEEQTDMDLQLTQLGMAIEVINHEFNANVGSIKKDLKRLGAWADLNQDLQGLYRNLRTGFEHLDGYLTLLTPLHRRLYRKPIEIKGVEINKFVQDLFGERSRKDDIAIEPTKLFLKKTVVEYPSSIYPVFVNLIDNALFWLKDQPKPRLVTLDADESGFTVSDNGPGIPERDREAIFELGFTRKPGGRGMGLFISREVLKKIGYKLSLDDKNMNRGATFRIERLRVESV